MGGEGERVQRFGVLGSTIAADVRGAPVTLPSVTLRRLAAVLVAHDGRVVSAWSLCDLLALSPAAVRSSVARLRRLVGADAVITEPPGYRLGEVATDVAAFRQLVQLAGETPRLDQLRDSLAMWRGEAYAEFSSEEWLRAEIASLDELRTLAETEMIGLLLDLGRFGSALERVAPLIEREPFQDAPRALRIRALALAGRTAEAAREYERYRRLLAEEVGLSPTRALTDLATTVIRGDLGLLDGATADERDRTAWPASVPAPATPLVGRMSEIDDIVRMVAERPLVTLVGPGGVGKTRLAKHVAARLASSGAAEVAWVDLAVVADLVDVPETILTALAPGSPVGPDPRAALAAEAARRDGVMIVLDNAEHLGDAVAASVAAVLRPPSVRVIVTSRIRLGLDTERVVPVSPLAVPEELSSPESLADFDAAAMFASRLHDAGGSPPSDPAGLADVAAICRLVDGLPLAIDFAATRARQLPLSEVVAGLTESSSMLVAATEAAVWPRHRSMDACIAWSVALLSEEERETLLGLSVLPGPFSLAMARETTGHCAATGREIIGRLADHHLIVLDPISGRYRMLATVRQHCLGTGSAAVLRQARRRHASYVAEWCTDIGAGRHGIRREPILAEMPHVVAAMEFARIEDPGAALRICCGLSSYRTTLGHTGELTETWRWLTTHPFDGSALAAWASATAALMASATGAGLDITGVVERVEAALPPDDLRSRGWLRRGSAMVPAYGGDLDPISTYVDEVMERVDDPELSVYGGFAVYMLAMTGHTDRAERILHAVRAMLRRHDTEFSVDTVGNAYAGALHVELLRGRGALADSSLRMEVPRDPAFSATAGAALAQIAVNVGRRDLMEVAERWSSRSTVRLLSFLPHLVRHHAAVLDGDVDAALAHAEEFWSEAERVPVSRLNQLGTVVGAAIAVGRLDTAAELVATAERLVGGMDGVPLLRCLVSEADAVTHLAGGDPETAIVLAHHAAELAEEHSFPVPRIDAFETGAIAAAALGRPDVAAVLAATARRERDRLGHRRVRIPADRRRLDELADRSGPEDPRRALELLRLSGVA